MKKIGKAIVEQPAVFRNIITPDWALLPFGTCWGMRDHYSELGNRTLAGALWNGDRLDEPLQQFIDGGYLCDPFDATLRHNTRGILETRWG